MIKIENCINGFRKIYDNNKKKEHLELKQCFDVSTAVYKSTDSDNPVFVAGMTGDYTMTFFILAVVCTVIFALALTTKIISKFFVFASKIFRHR